MNDSAVLMWLFTPVITDLTRGINHMLDDDGNTYVIIDESWGKFKVTVEKIDEG